MAGSDTDLANAALAMLREDPITNIDDPDDPRAKEAKRLFLFSVRDQCLRAFDWGCVRTRVTLASLGLPPNPASEEWTYAYQLPANCLAARRLARVSGTGNISPYPTGLEFEKILFVTEGSILLTQEAPDACKLVYTRQEPVVGKYDALLWDAMATRLAAQLAFSRVGNFKLGEQLWEFYLKYKTPEAAGANDLEGFARQEQYTPSRLRDVRSV